MNTLAKDLFAWVLRLRHTVGC